MIDEKELREAVQRKKVFMLRAVYYDLQAKRDEELFVALAEAYLKVGNELCPNCKKLLEDKNA